jgi:hypothetical protein
VGFYIWLGAFLTGWGRVNMAMNVQPFRFVNHFIFFVLGTVSGFLVNCFGLWSFRFFIFGTALGLIKCIGFMVFHSFTFPGRPSLNAGAFYIPWASFS